MERRDQGDRKVSFNPEAAAFSPITTAAEQAEDDARAECRFAKSAVPHDSPLETFKKLRIAASGEASDIDPDRLQLQNLVDKGLPAEALMRSLGDTATIQAQGTTLPPLHDQAQFHYASNPAFYNMYQPFPPVSNFTIPGVEELNASLGLPSALGIPSAKIPAVEESPARSHVSVGSQKLSRGDLYSKLLTRAQGTPLTADSLAHMLKSRSDSSEETIRASRAPLDPFVEHDSPAQAVKVVRPPPGFGNQKPRMVTVEDEQMPSSSSPGMLAGLQQSPQPSYLQYQPMSSKSAGKMPIPQQSAQPKYVQHEQIPSSFTGMLPNLQQSAQPSFLHHPRPSIGESSTSFLRDRSSTGQSYDPFQQHAHQPSGRGRRPRVHTRTKRTDQGPEPSAADIYPDDAHWMPSEPINRSYFAPPPYPPQQQVQQQIQNALNWPTPAEVYLSNSQPPAVAHSHQKSKAQPFNLFQDHVAPSEADKSASDEEVHTLLDQMPEPSIDTLLNFGATDLILEERPLTPLQKTGNRYGLGFIGIGLGDPWTPAVVSAGHGWDNPEPFRVRPRDHEGWGGWEWAIKKGWGDE